jgi:uncharacterized membrane protein (UPF0127 family)
MDTGRLLGGVTLVLVVVLVVAILVVTGVVPLPVGSPDEYERTTVAVYDENGTQLGQVRVRIADTFEKRYTGLSDTESLGPNEGMLFVYDEEATRTFVMREMDFPLDIVFVETDGTITTIHHAPTPPPRTREDELTRYQGRGKWVLEVNRNWTTEHGVDVGDRVDIGS